MPPTSTGWIRRGARSWVAGRSLSTLTFKLPVALAVACALIAASLWSATSAVAGGTPPPILTGAGIAPYSVGFGKVKPSEIYLGGDATGMICHIRWDSWGGQFAIGTGTAFYLEAGQITADGHWVPAVIVAYHLGVWHGKRAYLDYAAEYPQGGSTYGGVQPCM